MEIFEALEAFASLSQETRLRVFKLIIEFGGMGLGPKQMIEELKIPDNTLSFHLSHLTKSGLISSRREGRQLFYTANTAVVDGLIDFLKENCCVRDVKSKKRKKC
ncbi:MAG: ArsR family transcriptional regulator [Proteobacteria bacterium]|nr:MAG: ArsR family transcriptional regulator [Pseudomonadota bacterium]